MSSEELYSHEIIEWNKVIDFYLDEINIFQERLVEVAAKNNKNSVSVSIEHFQNQFIAQKDSLQILKHDIHGQEEDLAAEIKKANKIFDMDIVDNQFYIRERLQMAEKIFIETKHSFYRFLAKVF
ncbi:MAG TPA: hypothetical protein VG738_13265 [Chitinophagaceae bacterium]|nr:hypothetical protein [Chitinophagaceae bacterium]